MDTVLTLAVLTFFPLGGLLVTLSRSSAGELAIARLRWCCVTALAGHGVLLTLSVCISLSSFLPSQKDLWDSLIIVSDTVLLFSFLFKAGGLALMPLIPTIFSRTSQGVTRWRLWSARLFTSGEGFGKQAWYFDAALFTLLITQTFLYMHYVLGLLDEVLGHPQ